MADGSDGDDDSDYEQSDDGSSEGDEDSQGTCVDIQFDLPELYPDEKPSIQILNSVNLDESELDQLMTSMDRIADESLGTVMIFTLVSHVVEYLATRSEQEAIEFDQEKEKRQKEAEAEETKRFDGTPVSKETFLAWKAKFDAEILMVKIAEQKQNEQSTTGSKRLTGRAMFELDETLAESDLNFVEDLDQNQIEALLHNIKEIDVNEDE